MLVVVGLGNPGSEYDDTRHNMGFRVVDGLAERLDLKLKTVRQHKVARGRRYGTEIALVKPLTFMNNSGEAVSAVLRETGTGPDDLLVCCDDLHLPLGTLRLRKQGSDGGHNGLASVIAGIGTRAFPRLRCGIAGAGAPGPGEATADYVLSDFPKGESGLAAEMAERAAGGILLLIRSGIDIAMNVVNTQ